jgi:hypothetical protein
MWWILWGMVAFGWAVTLYLGDVVWPMVALGAATAFVITLWSMEMTGDKMPPTELPPWLDPGSGRGKK